MGFFIDSINLMALQNGVKLKDPYGIETFKCFIEMFETKLCDVIKPNELKLTIQIFSIANKLGNFVVFC